MDTLYERLAVEVRTWRARRYTQPEYPAVAEILDYQVDLDTNQTRYLRAAQLRALETYWYLRLVAGTPRVFDLYRTLFPKRRELREALGLTADAIRDFVEDHGEDALWQRVREDDEFVRAYKLEAVRETLTLDYPSYILALAMGAGKTALIGAIFATEFALAQEYPDGPFVQNALVFAPGKTILESLRELAAIPYDRLLPPRLHKSFAASVKLTITRDGERDIPVVRGSTFNVVVTNTEKIRIQKETVRKADLGGLFAPQAEGEARAEVANLRLQAIASLPHLAVFSDEAHHTYGQSLDTELKKVRRTVDYLATNTNLIAVVNTTGTPYFQRQPLRDVVVWYGLSEGIRDGILKDLDGEIKAFEFGGDASQYVAHVITDFFGDYGEVRLPNGAAAKLALYFPQTDDLAELRPVIDQALVAAGQSPAVCLVNTSDATLTRLEDIAAFNRLNDPASPHRVILLVNKGTEGWNCPSLFACALVRKLKTSNNFVLQASTRCLRQVPGNRHKARVYLSSDNFTVLDRQLQETYGESIQDLNHAGQELRQARVVLRKPDAPPLVITRIARTIVPGPAPANPLRLKRPTDKATGALTQATFALGRQQATASVLRQMGETLTVTHPPVGLDAYTVAVDLASRYRLDVWDVLDALRAVYGADEVPDAHLTDLARQVERQTRAYTVHEEQIEVALALVKHEGFEAETDAHGQTLYTAEIQYRKDREKLLAHAAPARTVREPGYHYSPYAFDSNPELSFYEQLLRALDLDPREVEDLYFTGGLTDPAKTDFYVEYKDEHGDWRRYTPDFIIRKRPQPGARPGSGQVLIVEIKAERERSDVRDGERGLKAAALRKLEAINPGRLRYVMIFAPGDVIGTDALQPAWEFIQPHDA